MMRWRRLALGLLALVVAGLLGAAVAIVWLPELFPPAWRSGLQTLGENFTSDPTFVLAAIGLAVLLLEGGRAIYTRLAGGTDTNPRRVRVQQRLQARRVAVTGNEQNRALETAIASMDLFDERPDRGMELDGLEALAVRVLGRAEGYTPEEARRLLATGEWTDDPRAAMVFTDITPPLRIRLIDRFRRQHRYERAVEAALTALEARLEAGQPRGTTHE